MSDSEWNKNRFIEEYFNLYSHQDKKKRDEANVFLMNF